MHTTTDLLDAVRRRHAIPSDNKLAAFLGIGRTNIANYRTGVSTADDRTALKIAQALGIEPGYVLACVHAERATRQGEEDVAAMWELVAGKFRAAASKVLAHLRDEAAAVFLALGVSSALLTGAPEARASTDAPSGSAQQGRLCVMSNRRRHALRALGRNLSPALRA